MNEEEKEAEELISQFETADKYPFELINKQEFKCWKKPNERPHKNNTQTKPTFGYNIVYCESFCFGCGCKHIKKCPTYSSNQRHVLENM